MNKIILFFVLTINILAVTYEGLIDNYPIILDINIENNEVSGSYKYKSQNIPMEVRGRRVEDKLYLDVVDKNNNTIEKFELFKEPLYEYDYEWLDVKELKNVDRYIGFWKKGTKTLAVDLRSDYILDYLYVNDDKFISEGEMKVFFPEVFGEASGIEIVDSYMVYKDIVEFYGKDSLLAQDYFKEIDLLTEEVRGKEFYFSEEYINTQKEYYNFSILSLSYNPKLLPNQEIMQSLDEIKKWLLIWSLKDYYNRELYLNFMDKIETGKNKFEEYVRSNFAYTEEDIKTSLYNFEYTILNRASGVFPSMKYSYETGNYMETTKISPLLNAIINNFDKELIYSLFLKSNFTESLEGINALILLGSNEDFVVKLLNEKEDLADLIFTTALYSLDYTKAIYENFDIYLDHQNDFGKTPLFYAVQYNNIDVVRYLVENGADINHKYYRSIDIDQYIYKIKRGRRSVFMHAVMHSDIEIIKYLANNGAFVKAIDELGDSAIKYTDDSEKLKYLKSLGL